MPIRKLRIAASLEDAVLGLKSDSENRGAKDAGSWVEFFEDNWDEVRRAFKE